MCSDVFSQELDTVVLNAVTVTGGLMPTLEQEVTVEKIDFETSGESLTDILKNEPSIYFKQSGNGQLSTISFRGTGAEHTNLVWHGVSVNYPSLGLFDFSQWPTSVSYTHLTLPTIA